MVPHLTILNATFSPLCQCTSMFGSPLHETSGILYYARHPSPTPTQVDLSLLVCAVEDSWTPSFLYKSPSEPDSGDSDLITAGNKQYQHHLGSRFIFSFPYYFLAPFATQPNINKLLLHWSWCAAEFICSLFKFRPGSMKANEISCKTKVWQ